MIEIADVFRRFAADYLDAHGAAMPPSHRRAIADILDCRTAALGGGIPPTARTPLGCATCCSSRPRRSPDHSRKQRCRRPTQSRPRRPPGRRSNPGSASGVTTDG